MGQGLLILCTRSLNNFSEGVENLTRNANCFEEVNLSGWVNELLA